MNTDAGILQSAPEQGALEQDRQCIPVEISGALDSLNEAMVLFAAEGVIVEWASPAAIELLALKPADFGRRNIQQRCPLLDPVIDCLSKDEKLQEIEVGGVRYTCQIARVTDKTTAKINQTIVWLKPRESESRDAESKNIRQYLEAREKLFTTSRTISVSEMATTLAHELNQPIGSITNILKGTRARLQTSDVDETILHALDRATEQTHFAARIIARIRDFTQSRQPVRTDCRIDELLNNSIALLDWVLETNSVTVECSALTPAPVVNGDETMLQQVFTNLIRNAVDAMQSVSEEDRRLRISVSLQNQNVQINFEDSGSGLSSADEQNLFVPFVTQKAQGMGVGLNICRSFIELHQGRLWLKPNAQGGCTACVVLAAITHD